MTAYSDIYKDLPARVYAVWQQTKTQENDIQRDLSVTAMLMAAAAGLAMPFENLKDQGTGNGKKWKEHPMFHEVNQPDYQATLNFCDSYFKNTINDCPELSGAVLIQCQNLKDIRNSVNIGKGDASMDIAKYTVRFALKILRNSLSHNNILTIPNGGGEIE